MLNSTCPIHGDSASRSNGQVCTCWRITFIVSGDTDTITVSGADWNNQLKVVRDWSATLHGQTDKPKQSVPQPFQNAFNDGELEL